MIINHNVPSMDTYRNLSTNQVGAQKSLEKLSSGLKINKAADDAAGLAISEKMRGQVKGLDKAAENAQNGVSLIQTAEGALNETHAILQRMRELGVQASNGTNTQADRSSIQLEMTALSDEIKRVGEQTEFNTKKLLDGSLCGTSAAAGDPKMTIQVGANSDQSIDFSITDMRTGNSSVGLCLGTAEIAVSGQANSAADVTAANAAVCTINTAITKVSDQRAKLGAVQNRLEHTISNLATSSQNLTAAESRVRDTDMAAEMMKFSTKNILVQAGTTMLAQANQAPQQVLSLLR